MTKEIKRKYNHYIVTDKETEEVVSLTFTSRKPKESKKLKVQKAPRSLFDELRSLTFGEEYGPEGGTVFIRKATEE